MSPVDDVERDRDDSADIERVDGVDDAWRTGEEIHEDLDEHSGGLTGDEELVGEGDPVGQESVERDDGPAAAGSFAEDSVAYECSAWAGESRGLLGSLLNTKGIPHVWQGTTLTVHDTNEDEVDSLIDDVLASARPALNPRADKVIYEVGTWAASFLMAIGDSLTAADIAYEYDEAGDLVVYADDEEEVEAILDELPDPDDTDQVDTDGLELHETLDRLFLASGKLSKNPTDSGAVVGVDEATTVLENMSLPFGFDRRQWHALIGRAQALRLAIEAQPGDEDALDDDAFRVLAGEVRDLVRQYV